MKKYFLLSHNREYVETPRLIGFYYVLDRLDIRRAGAHKLPERPVVRVENRKEYDLPDLLNDDNLFLLSDEAKKVFSFYDRDIVFKTMILLSHDGKMQARYNLPVLEHIECLHKDSEIGKYGVLERPVLDREKIFGKSIFMFGEDPLKRVVRLDVAESLLERNLKGFVFTEIESR
jgi:hypothetical protein